MRHKVHVPPCRFCAKQFQRTEHLRRHERTHTREKPYGCYCGSAFTRRDLLSRHNKLAHNVPQQDERAVADTSAANTTGNPTAEPMSITVAPSGLGIAEEHGVSPKSVDARGPYSSAGLPRLGTSPQDSIAAAATSSGSSGATNFAATGTAHLRTPPARCEDHHSSAQISSHHGLIANIDSNLAASVTRATSTTRSAATAAIPSPASVLTSTQTHDANGLEGLGEAAMPRIQDTLASQEMWDFHFADNLDLLWGDPSTQPSLLIPPLFLSTLPPGVGVPIYEHSSSNLDMSMFVASANPIVGMTVVDDIDFEPPRAGTFSRYESRLPSMHLDNDEHPAPPGSGRAPGPAPGKTWRALQPESASNRDAMPWRISQEDHEIIIDQLQSHASTLPPGFVMPSRHALCRYVEGFFTGFHEHLPCLHTSTFTLVDSAPELVVAIAATGARYRFQRQQADILYRAAMVLLEAQLRRRDSNSFSSAGHSRSRDLQTMQAMILLIALGTWNQRSVLREAFATASQLATMIREQGRTTPAATRPESLTWHDWIAEEGARRVKIVAYSFSNLHSIAYNIPPKLTTAEMGPVQLPAPETHWRAADEAAWHAARNKDVHVGSSFAKSYSALFVHVADAAEQSTVSSFGNYVLMHGIIQQIFLVRQSSFPFASSRGDTKLSDDILEGLGMALRRWQRQWEMTRDSSLDPLAPGGPLSFNATALFRLAYIRLYADLGSYRHLDTRDPGAIAQGLWEVPLLDRLSHVERAALQAAHSLSIPVHIGVEYVAQTQTLSWSIVHSLCNVECAIYLSKWLETVAMALAEGKELRTGERSIVSIVASIINETDLGPPLLRETNSIRRIRRMAAAVVRLWACIFQGAHVFEIMGTIGAGLDLFADMLEQTVTNDKDTGPA